MKLGVWKPRIKYQDGYWYVLLCGITSLDNQAMEWVVKNNRKGSK